MLNGPRSDQQIAAQRLAYSVSYVSTSGDTTARTITIGGPEKPNAGRTGTFTAKPQSAVLRLDGLPTAVVRRARLQRSFADRF